MVPENSTDNSIPHTFSSLICLHVSNNAGDAHINTDKL